ncbi:hypothetical protein Ciccas_001693 [Cichlidogyrus casuarinus]|uniref:cysteine--tRNA ligase n=1 Tax=Cichlidogyrus casuarinus TaxID=1844966 RepID=A0ABD2QJE4_9PLAT
MEKRQQPLWNPPDTCSSKIPELYLYNSLTSKKERFIPQETGKVTWYSCGPTVYDSSHMGHARTYIAFDILRRTMQNYFNFNIYYVMNITDIDDKIIKRARQRYLFDQFKQEKHSYEEMKEYIRKAIEIVDAKSKTDPEPEKRTYLAQEANRLKDLLASASPGNTTPESLLEASGDALSDLVDKERGFTVSDFKIFESLPRFYENEFHEDMKALNILPPNHLVRVSEYIEPIIKFTQQIIDNGFAYSTPSGSVYFDTNKFAQDPKHFYAKLVPTAFGDLNQLAAGEGELSMAGEKKSQSDFALWKASKSGEPAWDSPWGKGRPGWHIECSAMASGCLGESMDIHSGGVDLKFPHHDNELAQSEACLGHSHWVRYFLHSGHLTIDNCKMSKSLKNFITIRQALLQHSPRQIRLAFLLHGWKDTLDYGTNTMSEALALDRAFYDFTFNVSHLVSLALSQKPAQCPVASSEQDNSAAYALVFEKCKAAVYSSLCGTWLPILST